MLEAHPVGTAFQNDLGSGGQSGVLVEPQLAVIVESLVGRKHQEPKAIARPAIVTEEALQALLLERT